MSSSPADAPFLQKRSRAKASFQAELGQPAQALPVGPAPSQACASKMSRPERDRQAIERGVWVDAQGGQLPLGLAMWMAIRKQDHAKLSRMIRAGAPLGDCSSPGESGPQPALSVAAGFGLADVGARLIKAKAPLEALDAHGLSPLLLACQEGQGEMVRLLLDAGADIGVQDPQGRSCLEAARGAAEDFAQVSWRAPSAALGLALIQAAFERQALSLAAKPAAPRAPKRF